MDKDQVAEQFIRTSRKHGVELHGIFRDVLENLCKASDEVNPEKDQSQLLFNIDTNAKSFMM